jgi:Tfp pilus assembly protein PilF
MRRLWLWMLAWGLMLGFVWAQNTLTPDLQKQFDRAVQLARAGKLKEAEPILRSILHKRPQFVPAHFNLGLVYRLQNQYDKAAYHFRTAAKLNPKDPLPLLELTRMALDRGKLDDAEGYLRTLRQRHPNHPEVAVLSGSLAMLRGRGRGASRVPESVSHTPQRFPNRLQSGGDCLSTGELPGGTTLHGAHGAAQARLTPPHGNRWGWCTRR